MAGFVEAGASADVVAFLERSLVAEMAAPYAANPAAVEAAVGRALGVAFPELLLAFGLAFLVGLAASYLLSRFGSRPPNPTAPADVGRVWTAPVGSYLLGDGFVIGSGEIVVDVVGGPDFIRVENLPEQPDYPFGPQARAFKANGIFKNTAYGIGQGIYAVNVRTVNPDTGTSSPTTPQTPEFPPLPPEQDAKVKAAVAAIIPVPKKPIPPDLAPQLAPLKDALDKLQKTAEECCAEDRTDLSRVLAELKKVLDRVRKVSENIGLPDLDGANSGRIFGPFETSVGSLAEALDSTWAALGPWSKSDLIQEGGRDKPLGNVRDGILGSYRRTGYFVPTLVPGTGGADVPVSSVQSHIQSIKTEGIDPSYHVGYPDTAPRINALKLVFTDTSKYKRRQNATVTIPNPTASVTPEQVKGAIPTRVLGSYFCTLKCADDTRISGWAQTPAEGRSFLLACASLTVSGPSSPLDFTSTQKTVNVPAISGTLLKPTGYVITKPNPDGTNITKTEYIS